MKISVTSSSVESSQPSSTCRYGSYLVCTWCHTEMLSFRCWPFLLAMNLNTAGTQAFSTSSENSQANFLNLCNHSLVLLLAIHMDKLPEDLGLPYILTCTLVLRHAASVWCSQPTLVNFKENMHRMPTRTVPHYLTLTDTQLYCRRKIWKHLLNLTLPGYAKTSSDIYDLTLSRSRWWTLVYFTWCWIVEFVVAWSRCELLRWKQSIRVLSLR